MPTTSHSTWHVITLLAIALFTLGCEPRPVFSPNSSTHRVTELPAASADQEALVQFSLLAALAADDYTGGPPLTDVAAAGDFGIGTFNNLDGEMIVLDGEIYQAVADGAVRPADLDGTTPFAAVTFFKEDGRIDNFNAATLTDLDEQLDRKLPRRNSPYAIRIDGEFAELTLRSVPAQTPPFRPLVEVVKDQVTWQHHNLRGTLIGIRCPEWMSEVNVSGYHWHFLSDDQKTGGHVLACTFQDASLRFDECTSVVIHIPTSSEFDNFSTDQVSDQDIEKIERQRSTDQDPK
jgi:acetolactate decarboxylase